MFREEGKPSFECLREDSVWPDVGDTDEVCHLLPGLSTSPKGFQWVDRLRPDLGSTGETVRRKGFQRNERNLISFNQKNTN